MNIEAKAVQPFNAYDAGKDKLLADLKVVVADGQQLIREAADSSSAGFAALRTRVEGKVDEARVKLGQVRTAMGENARFATDATDAYVKHNPWKFAGVSVAAGLVLGFLLGRR
jgi:ElaB/YqjD/DUF883 family membrane-anchored ribosome-binding protein